MKNGNAFRSILFTGMLSALLCFSFLAFSSQPAMAANSPDVYVNGELMYFVEPPYVSVNGTTMVEMRSIFEALGISVGWEPATKKITAMGTNGVVIEMWVDSWYAYVDGVEKTLQAPPIVYSGRTMIPLRFVGEAIYATVDWDGANNAIYINSSN